MLALVLHNFVQTLLNVIKLNCDMFENEHFFFNILQNNRKIESRRSSKIAKDLLSIASLKYFL